MKMLIRLLLIVLFILPAANILAVGGDLGNGTGIAEDPYLIEDFADFEVFCAVPEFWDDYTRLDCDLDLDPDLPGRQQYNQALIAWSTDSSYDGTAYSGSFDGNGHVISNLNIDQSYYAGLFGYIDADAHIMNLGLENVSISGLSYVGCLMGRNDGSVTNSYSTGMVSCFGYSVGGLMGENFGNVEKCYADVSVSCTAGSDVGGLIGMNHGGSVTDCSAAGSVSSTGSYVGGLLGLNRYGGTITRCFATGSVETVGRYVGGLVGSNFRNSSVTGSYSTGSVIGDDSTGGLVGANSNDSNALYCYSTGSVRGNEYVGGFMGRNGGNVLNCYSIGSVSGNEFFGGFAGENEGSVTNCFWDIDTSGMRVSYGGKGQTTARMKQMFYYTLYGWGGDIWTIDEGNDYPHLAWENVDGQLIETELVIELEGAGTADDPWIINSKEDLFLIRSDAYFWDNHYILNTDIDFSGTIFQWEGLIGFFTGSFDGNGHVFNNLTIDGGYYIGVFGRVGLGGQISNLGIENCNITGGGAVGSMVGLNEGTISNCYSTGSIRSDYQGQNFGGLVGYNKQGSISNCFSSVEVSGYRSVGGLLGINHYGNVTNSYATGSVDCAVWNAGGLAGDNVGGSINTCYSIGIVNVKERVGGLVGYNYNGTVSDSYSTGDVSGNENSVGGLVGHTEYGSILNSFASGEVTGQGNYIGGLVGLNNYGSIKTSYSTGVVNGNAAVGGLVGKNYGTVAICYSTGQVNGSEDYSFSIGGLLGYNQDGDLTRCFWDVDTSGIPVGYNVHASEPGTVTDVFGKMTTELLTASTFTDTGWDFVGEADNGQLEVWYQLADEYPKLYWQADAGDMDCDGGVGMADLALIAGDWLVPTTGSYRSYGDVNFDGVSDLSDFAVFADGM